MFLDKLDHFLAAAAARYDGSPEVAFIDVGSFGVWGEGHTFSGSLLPYSAATVRRHIDLYRKHFRRTLLAANDDFASQGRGLETIRYARERGLTLRDDSILVEAGDRAYFHAYLAPMFWNEVPVVLESEHYGGSNNRRAWGDGSRYLEAIEDYHASYATVHWYPREFLKECRPLVAGRPIRRELRNHPRIEGVRRLRQRAHPHGNRRPERLRKVHAHPILRIRGPRPAAGSRCHSPRFESVESAAIAAGRDVLKRTAGYLSRGLSFAVETTLSSRGRVDLIRKAKSRGYEIHLVFIGLDSPERCITRIRNQAARGGHFIPDADVRRRYVRSVANAFQALRSADVAKFYDNSGDGARLILVANAGLVVWQAQPFPEWLRL